MNATALDESGRTVEMIMGCYGIGVTRIVAAAIEQNHDDRGIVWPAPVAPFQVALAPINMGRSQRTRQKAESLYEDLLAAGIDTLFDDRDIRPGVMFADLELIGIPHRVVLGERGLDSGTAEYKGRHDGKPRDIPLEELLPFLRSELVAN